MIKVNSGHLTATNKRCISEMLNRGMTEGQSGRIVYRITRNDEGSYSVEVSQVERNDYAKPVNRLHRATFIYSN